MASVNLDIVRSIYADWERGDYRRTDWADPALVAWEDWRSEAEEYRELDDERILAFVRRSGRGRVSGVDLSQMRSRGAALWHLRDGNVTKIVLYFDREHALADLGLS